VTCPPKTDPQVILEYWVEGGRKIGRKQFNTEQIIGKVVEAEVALSAMYQHLE